MAILGSADSIDEFNFLQYVPNNAEHEALLEHYMSTTDIDNNSTRKKLKVNLYDNVAGALFLLVHKKNNTIDAMTSCVRYDEHDIASAKVWHRLHIKNNVPNTAIDIYFEQATYKWCYDNNIQRLWVTFNEDTPRTAYWAAGRMGERRNANRPNTFTQFGNEIRAGWRPHDKIIFEKSTWQFVIYYSPNNQFFLRRDERPLNTETTAVFKREFPNATQNWQ